MRLARSFRRTAAFTMVEIALSLAIIGFALVAIIGVLPAGLNVQRENREDTIITQEANYFMEAIRSGARGLNDLTNNVICITNYWTELNPNFNPWQPIRSGTDGYTPLKSSRTSYAPAVNDHLLNSGSNIVGLLSMPKLEGIGGNVRSNHVVALVRSIAGVASDKFPQTNQSVLDLSLNYRMVAEVHNLRQDAPNSPQGQRLRANLHEVRLKFSWPLLPGNRIGNGRQAFRLAAGGEYLSETNNDQVVYFFNPGTYQQVFP